MTIEIVRRNLNPTQIEDLITIVNESETFKFDHARRYVDVADIKKEHPNAGMGPLPVGRITSDTAELLNTEIPYLRKYHRKLRPMYARV
ncbi:hypothetical protein CMO83_00020 [Candidatus Woesearchaeota archaeon]|jgi:hypothetical protein|nr:hypothetical protein [Candidatus Woesearchaeota archaeon]|tara:strand:+ start:1921 stop:2187 length:267 start_codon:yes stop_codon:yes gene_type:complete